MLKEMLAGDVEMAKVDLTRFASGLFNEEPRVLIVVAAQKHKQIDAKGLYIQYIRRNLLHTYCTLHKPLMNTGKAVNKKERSQKNRLAAKGKKGVVADAYASYCDVSVAYSHREIHKSCTSRYNNLV